MLYRIVVDGTDILDHSDPTMVLLSPQLTAEIDVAGSLEFTVPPNHKYYDWFTAESIMPMTIEVYEGDILHWFGRPMEIHLDFYKNKKLYCEGGLSFFNDSVIREEEYDNVDLSVIFQAVITEHNSMVPSNRQFTVGQFTVADHAVYRKFNYEQTSDALKSKFLDAEEGHFFVRRISGVNYIDFLKDMPYSCNQQVEFAENLLNFTYSFDAKDFATCVIPLGKNDAETNKPITIKSVNSDSDILVGNTASIYGNIVKVQQYSDLEDPNELKSEGQKYLTRLQYNAYLIECSAVDLHATDETKQQFRVGQMVHCVSNPHGIELDLPISKMTLYLDSAAKQITLGRIPKKTLSRFYKEKSFGGGSGVEQENEVPEGWEIVPPDEDGGEPTLKRVPVTIQITHLPWKNTGENGYQDGQTFDSTGIEVKLVATGLPNLTYFTDEYYISSVVPTSELSFEINGKSISSGDTITWTTSRLLVWVIWRCQQLGCPYYGRTHRKGFYIENKDMIAREAGNEPDHIVMEVLPAKLEYYSGNNILLAGSKVVAYTANNTPYNADGYENGVIPHTELTLNPAIADIDKATLIEYTNLPDYLPDYMTDPVIAASSASVSYNSYGEDKVLNISCSNNDARILLALDGNSRRNFYSIICSKSPGTTTHGGVQQTLIEQTYHDQTFYVGLMSYGLSPSDYITGISPDNGYVLYNGFGSYQQEIGYFLLFDGESEGGQMSVEVSWQKPKGGGVLTTSFNITVKQEHGR